MRISHRAIAFVLILVSLAAHTPRARAAEWKEPEIRLPSPATHPVVACTAAELERLRAAWRASGRAHDLVAERIERADAVLARPIEFPPRGGQHNQWYQCDACQLALSTIDDTHHQCPRCKKIYSGMPYDDVIFARKHGANLANMEAAAWAYAITGERKYAEFAKQILLGYAERYEKYPYHANDWKAAKPGVTGGHLAEQTLNEASMMAGEIAPAYDLIHDSGVLSPADHEAIRAGLLLPMLKNIDKYKAGKGNWQTWHNAAMIAGGAVLGDLEWVRKAIADPRNGFYYQMEVSVSGDGMWYENSWGYHYYTLSAMVAIVESARRLGIDLWGHPTLKKMFTSPALYAMPDGSLPRFGDDVQSRASSVGRYAEPAWNALHDPALRPYLDDEPSWQSILFGRKIESAVARPRLASQVFESAGHAVLRSNANGMAAVMTFGPYGGFHGHFDKLSFVFFGHGRELGVDPGRARSQAYRLPIHGNWYKATVGHNAVLVDRAPQKPAGGSLEAFAANDQYAAALARCTEAYPGVTHRRLLCLTPTYLLVFDELTGDAEHRFDWTYHNRGAAAECDAATESIDLGRAFAGSEYIKNARAGKTDAPIAVRFAGDSPPDPISPVSSAQRDSAQRDSVATHLFMNAAPDTEVLTGDGPCASILDRVPMTMIARRGKTALFAAVLEPVAKGSTPEVKSVECAPAPDGAQITIRRAATTDRITVGANGAITLRVGDSIVFEK
jgi:hypothetical protein